MTPALFRHCAVVRLLAVSTLDEHGTRVVSVDGWCDWSADLNQLDGELGRALSDALTPTQPIVDVEERIAILDTVLRGRAREGVRRINVNMTAAVEAAIQREHGKSGWVP